MKKTQLLVYLKKKKIRALLSYIEIHSISKYTPAMPSNFRKM
jgi:hypothetical protein